MKKFQVVFYSGEKVVGFYPERDTLEQAELDLNHEEEKNSVFKYPPYERYEIKEK